jgi:hypothetical protein
VYPLELDPDTLLYYVLLPYNNSLIPTISATAAWQGTEVIPQNPSNPFGNGTITVTSEDGQNIVIYTIVFQRKGNPLLVDLSYDLDSVNYPISDFSPTKFEYDVKLDIGTTAVPYLVYFEEDNRCIIETVDQDTPNGTSSVTLVTWNEDATVTYTVNFTVELSTNALLSDLQIDGLSVPNFSPDVFDYIIPIYEYGHELPVVTAEAAVVYSEVDIKDIEEFPGVATVTVTAENQSFTNTYTISFSVEAGDNTYLEDLLIGGVHWYQFNKNQYHYEYPPLPFGTTEFPTVEGIPEDERSIVDNEITGNGETVKIYVTALNGDVAVYEVVFVVAKNDNALATMIYVDWEPLKDFDKYVKEYDFYLPDNYMGIPEVTVETEDVNASYKTFIDIPYLTQVIVTAEDGEMQMIYLIHFYKPHSITSFNNDTDINVYPNPATDNIYFEVLGHSQNATLEIFTFEGKKIDNYILKDGINTINISSLQKSLYFFKILSNKTILGTGKFVKN